MGTNRWKIAFYVSLLLLLPLVVSTGVQRWRTATEQKTMGYIAEQVGIPARYDVVDIYFSCCLFPQGTEYNQVRATLDENFVYRVELSDTDTELRSNDSAAQWVRFPLGPYGLDVPIDGTWGGGGPAFVFVYKDGSLISVRYDASM